MFVGDPEVEALVDVLDLHVTGKQDLSLGRTGPGLGAIVLVVDLPDDLLQEIFHRDDACGSPELVEDHRHVTLQALEVGEHILDFPRARHEERLPHDGGDRRVGIDAPRREHLLHVHDAHDVVQRLAVDRIP